MNNRKFHSQPYCELFELPLRGRFSGISFSLLSALTPNSLVPTEVSDCL